ncbi:MAG: M20/M25/M40 family metallo-hydrolase, partial [Planctomycetota bacterium]
MKGGIAAIVTAVRRIVDSGTKLQGDIIFVAAAGEETDSCGAKRFISDSGRLPEFIGVVIPEPTDFEIVTAHRGMLWLEVATKGKAAHGSTPHLGVNAISSMRSVLEELENYPRVFLSKTRAGAEPHKLLGECSMSINTIAGGKALNVVPDKCSIGVDIRTLPAQNHQDIIANLKTIFTELKAENPQFDAEVSVIRQVESMETDRNCDFVKDFCSAVGIDKTT